MAASRGNQLARHLHHRSPEADAPEQPLRVRVLLRRRQNHTWGAARPKLRQHRVKQQPAHSAAAMIGIDDDVMEQRGGPAEHHVVVPFQRRVGIADHLSRIRNEDHRVRFIELRGQIRRVAIERPAGGREKAPAVEFVVLLDEQRAQPAKAANVVAASTTDDGGTPRHVAHGTGLSSPPPSF